MNAKKLMSLVLAAALMLTASGAALADTIEPNPPKISLEDLGDRFVTTNLEYKGDGIVTFTLLENEQFDAEAIKAAKAGDVIFTDGEEITVDTVEWDGPDLYFNRGTDREMLFADNADGTFERVMEDDMVPQLNLGSMDKEIEPYVVMLDWVDAETGDLLEEVAVRTGDELKALLEKGDGPSFAVENVRVLYDHNGQPVLVWRFYSSAQ